ncbi:MAG: sulfatase [bacterium]
MGTSYLLPLGLALVCTACVRGPVDPVGPPSVVLFVADDQGLFMGAYGQSSVTTPHLDRLASEGLRFDGAYAVTAVCTPSRAALYTGRFPAGNGCDGFGPIREGVSIWGDLLGPAGYRTGLIGKLGGKPLERFKFDFFARNLPAHPGARSVDWYVEQLEAFLSVDDPRPFCLVVNLRDAHYPFPTDGAPTGRSEGPEPPHDPARVTLPGFLPDLPAVRQEFARFHDSLRRLDVTVGLMLEVLDERVPAEELLVVHTTDHGIPFPFAKTTLYEAGIRVSLVARWPGTIAAGGATPALTSLADLLPTLLELAGAPVPEAMDGRSLARVLRGETDEHHAAVFGSHTHHRQEPMVPSRSIRVGDWKYIRNYRPDAVFKNAVMMTSASWGAIKAEAQTDSDLAQRVANLERRPPEELFNLADDPWELTNLAGKPEASSELEDLRRQLDAFLERQADPLLDG